MPEDCASGSTVRFPNSSSGVIRRPNRPMTSLAMAGLSMSLAMVALTLRGGVTPGGMNWTPATPVSHLLPQSGCRSTEPEATGVPGRVEKKSATTATRTKRKRTSVTLLVGMALGIVAHYTRTGNSREVGSQHVVLARNERADPVGCFRAM